MFFLYRIIVAGLFYILLPLLLFLVVITGRHRRGLLQRFGFYRFPPKKIQEETTVWIHAASVGEVQAARAVIVELKKRLNNPRFCITTMTVRGRGVAQNQLGSSVTCLLAPLDVPFIIERAVEAIKPDIYICLETELWPILIDALSRKNIQICMINGRISERSMGKYVNLSRLMKHVLQQFDRLAVISENDKSKFVLLGADENKVSVLGNVKYEITVPLHSAALIKRYRQILHLPDGLVFIAGSTHSGEEELLVSLYHSLESITSVLFIVAPRHIERIGEIEKMLRQEKIDFQLFSQVHYGEKREKRFLLLDTMGELAHLYCVGDYIFCGGSLVNKGGHNLMEAALWQKVVFYGPFIDDFQDAAELLEAAGAGCKIDTVSQLFEAIVFFQNNPDIYQAACRKAGETARKQQGGAARQVDFILSNSSLQS